MLTLKKFEQQINEAILKRGRQYYDSGAVIDIEETEENEWEAAVEGSDIYSVEIKLKNNNEIIECFCDCPYDGGTCKHAVSVFYAIR